VTAFSSPNILARYWRLHPVTVIWLAVTAPAAVWAWLGWILG